MYCRRKGLECQSEVNERICCISKGGAPTAIAFVVLGPQFNLPYLHDLPHQPPFKLKCLQKPCVAEHQMAFAEHKPGFWAQAGGMGGVLDTGTMQLKTIEGSLSYKWSPPPHRGYNCRICITSQLQSFVFTCLARVHSWKFVGRLSYNHCLVCSGFLWFPLISFGSVDFI